MTAYRYIGPDGDEVLLEGAEALLQAVHSGNIRADTLVRDLSSEKWIRADEVIPSAFSAPVDPKRPPEDRARVPPWVAVLGLSVVGFWSAGFTSSDIAFRMAWAFGWVLVVCGVGWLLTRVGRPLRRHWPLASLGVGLALVLLGIG